MQGNEMVGKIKTILATALAAFFSLSIGLAQAADTPISFRLDWTVYGVHAPFFLALEKGLYKKEGLDVTIHEGQGSATVVQQLGRGQNQLALVDCSTLLFAVEKGLPVTVVMRVVSNILGIIYPADAPIKSPKGLEGKIIAFAPSESSGMAFSALMAADGGDIKKVNILNPATGAKNTLLLEHRVDAIPGNINVQPQQLEAKGMKVGHFLYSDFGVKLMGQGVVANNTFLKEHPDAVKRFLAATVEAIKMAKANPEAAVDAIIEAHPELRQNRAIYLSQWQASLPGLTTPDTKDLPMGTMLASDWKEMQQVMEKGGVLNPTVAPEKIFSNDYLPKN
ncbi:MAG: hypothetical protein EPN45_09195 [Rhizobiaceae bacterium]|nr:MAG: hypothetical protein EPN45_09195 [Rhizobiaceae bacterium]